MTAILMRQVYGISALRLKQTEVLAKVKEGPVLLAQRSEAVAVLVTPELWNELVERVEDLEDALAVAVARNEAEPTTDFGDYVSRRDREGV